LIELDSDIAIERAERNAKSDMLNGA